ncbi:MAG: anti-sigma factor domain-containing protein [Pseudonocardiaceae bacterium]
MSRQNDASGCPHRELAVGWALHALEPAEEYLVAAHLPDCSECTRIVAETEQIGATLGLSIPEEIPSAELEQRVLAVPAATGAAQVIPLVQPPQRTGNRRVRSRYLVLAAAASMVLVVGSVALGIRVVQLDGERAQAQRQITAMSELIKRAADPATDRVPLVTPEGRPMGVVFAGPYNVAVVSTALPANRVADQIYVLWGLPGGTSPAQVPQALIGFDVIPDAPVPLDLPSVRGAGEFVGYAVSLEPGRRLPASPTTVVASGEVDS